MTVASDEEDQGGAGGDRGATQVLVLGVVAWAAMGLATSGDQRVLALTAHMDAHLIRKTYAAGADGYLIKNVVREELARSIRLAADGRPYVSREVAALLLESARGPDDAGLPAHPGRQPALSPDEMRLLACMAGGLTQRQTIAELGLEAETLTAMESALKDKFRAYTTAQALMYAIECGLARCES